MSNRCRIGPVHDPVPGLIYIFDITNIAFQVLNLIIDIMITKCYGIVGFVVMIHCSCCPGYSATIFT